MKVLVIEDSSLYQKVLNKLLSSYDFVTSVEIAGTGQAGLAAAIKSKPDVITLDVDLPDFSGLKVLQQLKAAGVDAPVVMVSSLTQAGTAVSVLSIEMGAVEIVLKPKASNVGEALEQLNSQLEPVLKALSLKGWRNTVKVTRSGIKAKERPKSTPKIVAIGGSTGAPKVLSDILRSLPEGLPVPVVVAIHMAAPFTKPFCDELNRMSPMTVVQAEDGDLLLPGTVFVAPGGKQMEVVRHPKSLTARISITDSDGEGYRPSVSTLFASVAGVFGKSALAIILSGMGFDGVTGLSVIKERGGFVMAQSKESCVITGMPGGAMDEGVVDTVAAPLDIPEYIVSYVS